MRIRSGQLRRRVGLIDEWHLEVRDAFITPCCRTTWGNRTDINNENINILNFCILTRDPASCWLIY